MSSHSRRQASRLHELFQYRAKANASFACKRGRFRESSFFIVATREPDADLVTTEHLPRALARGVLMVDQFALPSAIRTGAGADVIEKCVTTADFTVVQHHHTGVAAVEAVKHPDVNGIETVSNRAFSGRRHRGQQFCMDNRTTAGWQDIDRWGIYELQRGNTK